MQILFIILWLGVLSASKSEWKRMKKSKNYNDGGEPGSRPAKEQTKRKRKSALFN